MSSAIVSRWGRRFLLTGGGFLVLAGLAGVAGLPRRMVVVLALQGFVFSVVFGKAYSLIPSYFDRTLAVPRAPPLQYPLHLAGVLALAVDPLGAVPAVVGDAGALCWAGGVAVFLGGILGTIADNVTGSETGTSDASADRAGLDRFANLFVPVALGYLVLGTVELASGRFGGPTLVGQGVPRVAHLLAAGVAALLLFAIGFRLLPRFLVASVPTWLAGVVLPAGAIGPLLIARGLYSGPLFQAGAALEAVAVVGFAVAFLGLYYRSDRSRIGFYGPLAGVVAGVAAVGLGVQFAAAGYDPGLVVAHRRLNLFGFLGLSILGIGYQFYPPAVGTWPGAGDRAALGTLAAVAIGTALAAIGALTASLVATVGFAVLTLGGAGWVYLLAAAMDAQFGQR